MKYKCITPGNHPWYFQKRWWLIDISCKSGYSSMWGIDITLVCPPYQHTLAFSERYWIGGLFRFLTVSGNVEIWIQNKWFLEWNLTDLKETSQFPFGKGLRLLTLSFIIVMVLVCAITFAQLKEFLNRISKPQAM